jgi:hypothetical protein
MAKYYPKSQIILNQFSQEGDTEIIDGVLVNQITEAPYTGFFWYTAKGDYFSGKTPNDLPTERLVVLTDTKEDLPATLNNPLTPTKSKIALFLNDPEPDIAGLGAQNSKFGWNQSDIVTYTRARGGAINNTPTFDNPYHNPILPTEKNYELGTFTRYIVKNFPSKIFIEVDEEMYNNILSKNKKVFYYQYIPVSLPWIITGDSSQVEQVNKNIVDLAIRKNSDLSGIQEYFKGRYLQYYGLYTTGGEFLLPNGQAYVGLYHIHPDKGPMVGRVHTPTQHDILTPINQEIPTSKSLTPTDTQQSNIYRGTNVTPTSTGY